MTNDALQMPYEFIMHALRLGGEVMVRNVVGRLEGWVRTVLSCYGVC